MGNERTLAGGRGRWFQFILWVLPTRSSLSNPVGRPTSRSPLPFSSSYACPSLFHQRSPRPFRFSTSSLSDSIVPLVSSRATSRPSFSPPSRKKNFLLSSPPSFDSGSSLVANERFEGARDSFFFFPPPLFFSFFS